MATELQLGVVVNGEGFDLQGSIDYAVSLEGAGFASVWFPEIQREPFVPLGVVAARTSTIGLGTAVAAWTRTPVTAALSAANLDQVSDGRFTLGLGTGPAPWNERFHGMPYRQPVARMREYVGAIRQVWTAHGGTVASFAGEHFRIDGYVRSIAQERTAIPVFLAAVQERMLRAAGAIADGVMLNVCTTPAYYEQIALPQLAHGARSAGRDPSDLHRASVVCVAIDDDPAQAREWARRHLSFYGGLPYFELILGLHGYRDEARRLQQAAAAEDPAAALAAVSDEMVDCFAVAGTPDHTRKRLAAFAPYLDTAVLFAPSIDCAPDEIVANYRAIRATFGSGA